MRYTFGMIMMLITILASCSHLPPPGQTFPVNGEKLRIAVLPTKMVGDVGLNGDFITENIITNIYKSSRFSVVERVRIEDVFSEIKLAQEGKIWQDDAQTIGKIYGAKQVLVSTVTKEADSFLGITYNIYVSLRLIDVNTGGVVAAAADKTWWRSKVSNNVIPKLCNDILQQTMKIRREIYIK